MGSEGVPPMDVYTITRHHAAVMRAYYDAYVDLGFSTHEAFALVREIVSGLMSIPPG